MSDPAWRTWRVAFERPDGNVCTCYPQAESRKHAERLIRERNPDAKIMSVRPQND